MTNDKLSTVALDRAEEDALIEQALGIIKRRMGEPGEHLDPAAAKRLLSLRYGNTDREVFGMLMLDVHNRLIGEPVELFQGTLTQVPVFPREVVKVVARSNAAGVVLFHTHPGGDTTPSEADRQTTFTVEDALRVLDVPVMDHMVVAGANVASMGDLKMLERGNPIEEALRKLSGMHRPAHRH